MPGKLAWTKNLHLFTFIMICMYHYFPVEVEITVDSFNVLDIKITPVQLSHRRQEHWLCLVFSLAEIKQAKPQPPTAVPSGDSTGHTWVRGGTHPLSHRSPPSFSHVSPSHKPHASPQPDSPRNKFTHYQRILLSLLSLLQELLGPNFHTKLLYLHFLSSQHSSHKLFKTRLFSAILCFRLDWKTTTFLCSQSVCHSDEARQEKQTRPWFMGQHFLWGAGCRHHQMTCYPSIEQVKLKPWQFLLWLPLINIVLQVSFQLAIV